MATQHPYREGHVQGTGFCNQVPRQHQTGNEECPKGEELHILRKHRNIPPFEVHLSDSRGHNSRQGDLASKGDDSKCRNCAIDFHPTVLSGKLLGCTCCIRPDCLSFGGGPVEHAKASDGCEIYETLSLNLIIYLGAK